MHQELQKLIDMALIDGDLSNKEKVILLRKAEKLGEDPDEVEMVINARLFEIKSKAGQTNMIDKCPSCGDAINGLSKVCPSCGYILNKKTSGDLDDAINRIEELIIEVKASPKPSFMERMKIVALTYFTFGLYLVYRKFKGKEGGSFDTLIARCDKEKRQLRTSFGEDKKVKLLLEELTTEIKNIQENRKKSALKANIGCLGVVVIVVLFYVVLGILVTNTNDNDGEYNKIDSLLNAGDVEGAKSEVLKVIDREEKNDEQDKITIYEIDELLKQKALDDAKEKIEYINSENEKEKYLDKIYILEINILLEKQKIDEAKQKASLIYDQFDREKILERITNIENSK